MYCILDEYAKLWVWENREQHLADQAELHYNEENLHHDEQPQPICGNYFQVTVAAIWCIALPK